jgi:hypothetical protein
MVENGEMRVLDWNTHLATASRCLVEPASGITPSFLLQSQLVSTGLNNFRLGRLPQQRTILISNLRRSGSSDTAMGRRRWGEPPQSNFRVWFLGRWPQVVFEIEPDAMNVWIASHPMEMRILKPPFSSVSNKSDYRAANGIICEAVELKVPIGSTKLRRIRCPKANLFQCPEGMDEPWE